MSMYKRLEEFIIHARRKTYASGKKPIKDKGKTYFIEEGEFAYQDSYYDQTKVFQGQEVVFNKNLPVWSFSYRGIVKEGQDAEKIFSFLRSCLHELSENRFHLVCALNAKDWKYTCKGRGRIDNFSGRETIYYANILVYQMHYFGGIIR